ncbi:MAG: ribonuclease III [Lachnospiraceae bacterium]|nr:ribonuclease III [Lachnospiraceae bacterium]MDO4734160.1 ribonuclease III [Lachnospiraceae bacterium]
MDYLNEFEDIIGYSFTNRELLITALTHSSFVNENRSKDPTLEDNERFEFFGDAIIEFYISEYLFNKYGSFPEGDMTKLRASMVCEQSLAECAKQIRLGEFMRMGKGEALSGGRERASITSDAFEALVAAIYLDSGNDTAVSRFIAEHLIKGLENKTLFFDAKTRLQEIAQQKGSNSLRYELISESGPSHNKTFEIAAILNEEEVGRGKGHSKKAAQQAAAEEAIRKLEQ